MDKVVLPKFVKRGFLRSAHVVLRTSVENKVVQHLDPFCPGQNAELDKKLEKK